MRTTRLSATVAALAGVAMLALASCSSSSSTSDSSGGSSGSIASSGATSTTITPTSITASDLAAVDVQGAKAFATLFVDNLRKVDPSVTQAQADCIPDALVQGLGAHHLLEVANQPFSALPQTDVDAVIHAFVACGIDEATVRAKLNISG